MCISHIRKTSQMWRAIICHSSHVFYLLLPELLVRTCWREMHYEHICTETGRVYRWRITALVFSSVSLTLLEKMHSHWKSKWIWAIESVLTCEHIVSLYPPSLRFRFSFSNSTSYCWEVTTFQNVDCIFFEFNKDRQVDWTQNFMASFSGYCG